MAMKVMRITGSFEKPNQVERAVDELKRAGFRSDRISVLVPRSTTEKPEDVTTPGEGAVAGAGTGILVGGALTWLAEIGTFAIPGIGPFLAAGPLAALLTGAGTGGIVGALIGLGFSDTDADEYAEQSRKGRSLLMVNCESDMEQDSARSILQRSGAGNISVSGGRTVSRAKEAKAEASTPQRPRADSLKERMEVSEPDIRMRA